MAAEDGDARRAERSATEVVVVRGEGAEGWLAVHGRSPTVVVGHHRPQFVAQVLELVDDLHSCGVQLEEGLVLHAKSFEQVEATLVETFEADAGEPGGEAVEQETVLGAGNRPVIRQRSVFGAGHGCSSLVVRVLEGAVVAAERRVKSARGV